MTRQEKKELKKRSGYKPYSFREFKADLPLYIMAAPGFICLVLFSYLPMYGLLLAFKDYNMKKGIIRSDWVGFQHFKFIFHTNDAWRITRNTILYNVVFIIVNMILAVILSMILSEIRSRGAAKVFQTIYMLPHFLSTAAIALIVNAFLHRSHGVVNALLSSIEGQQVLIDWYKKPAIWPFLFVFINAWKGVGYQTVLYLAVISGISRDYYEAAVLDGASRFQQARYITLPHLRFIISISLIMAVGSIMYGDFGLFYTIPMDSGALYEVSDVLDTYIYRGLINMNNVGMSTAAGLYQTVVGFFLVIFANWVVTKVDPESAMF